MYVLIVLICDILIQKNILGLFITIKFTVKFAVSVHRFILDNKVYGSIVKYPDFLLIFYFAMFSGFTSLKICLLMVYQNVLLPDIHVSPKIKVSVDIW